MRIALCWTALKSLGAQLLITAVLGATAIGFGAGVANAARWRPDGPWPGYGFGPYTIVAPGPTGSNEDQGDASWPPTGASWPPGGAGGASRGSSAPIVMPHNQQVRSTRRSEAQRPIVPAGGLT